LDVVTWQLRSNLDFGPVVKPLGITVKKEAGKVVETSGEIEVVKLLATKGVSGAQRGGPKKRNLFVAWCLRRYW